jgi:zinc protease
MEPASSFQLDNGMRFIVGEDHAVPAAAFGIWTRAGVCDEPPDRRGIAHYFEHMMFRGSERFGPKEHTRRIARTGGDCNAFTGFDETVYHQKFPSAALEQVFELEADRFMRLKLAAEAARTEKKVVLEELRVYENQPIMRAFRRLLREIGGDHPYALDPLGRKEDLEAASRDDLEVYYRRLYRPGNVFAVAAGDVEAGRVRELAERHFGSWRDPDDLPAGGTPPRYLPATGARAERLSFEVPLAVRVNWLPPSDRLDHAGLDLLVALLADGESSPIQETLVKKKRLCVHAGAHSFKLLHGGGLVFFGAFLPPGKHAARRQVIRDICEKLAADGPDVAEFEKRLRRFRKNRAAESYSAHKRMLGLGEAEMLEGSYLKYERALEDLAAVTPERVRDLARKLFAPGNTLDLDIIPEKTRWWMPLAGLFLKVWPR